ncbi:MAG TPA: VWA domain-containing protein [Vicinamibacterales bacterium]|nr:VWA domain-containing protein [Vicinamibacterales bacterium]
MDFRSRISDFRSGPTLPVLALTLIAMGVSVMASPYAQSATGDRQDQGGFKFKSGVELINVTATVTDRSGRFYSRLTKDDFLVYEDNKPVEVTHFSADRTPVSLGIVVDSSGSMAGEKWASAVNSIDRFFRLMNDELDEFFLYRFSGSADLVADWTNDRDRLASSMRRIHPNGGTAMYDAASEAVPMAQSGQNRKKAIVIISDGNDTSSRVGVGEVKQLVRETEVLVYAVGIDGQGQSTFNRPMPPVNNPPRLPIPIPFPGSGRRGGGGFPIPGTGGGYPPVGGGGGRNGGYSSGGDDHVNVMALREITDDSGGRTEIVRDFRDLDPAVASIADELSQQYYIGYPSPGYKDGRWHTIRVELRDPALKVRARKGYVATP